MNGIIKGAYIGALCISVDSFLVYETQIFPGGEAVRKDMCGTFKIKSCIRPFF